MYTHVYIYIYIYIHIHAHTYTHTSTHIHIHGQASGVPGLPPPMVWSGRGGGGGLACAESGLVGWVGLLWAARGHREGRVLTQALRKP